MSMALSMVTMTRPATELRLKEIAERNNATTRDGKMYNSTAVLWNPWSK
jgi:hypothetical protein